MLEICLQITAGNVFHDDVKMVLNIMIFNVFDYVRMFDGFHDFHLVAELSIENTILHVASFLKLLDCKMTSFRASGQLINICKCSFAKEAGNSVFWSTIPFHAK